MTEPQDPLEQALAEELHALVDAEHAPPGLSERARSRLPGPSVTATRRGRLILGAVASAAAVALFALVAAAATDDSDQVDAADDQETTTTEPETTTTEASTTSAPSTTTSTVAAAVEPPTTVTTIDPPADPRCTELTGEGSDNAGWEDHWTSDPGPNRPASIRLCVDDVTPAIGQVVTATLVGDDPDAVIVDEECGWVVFWSQPYASFCRDYLVPDEEPVPPPAKAVGHVVRSSSHAYDTPGRHLVVASISSSEYEGRPHPYASYVSVELVLEAHG